MAPPVAYKPAAPPLPNADKPIDVKEKNLMDFMAKFGARVCLRAVTNGAGQLIYTVPEGKTFFLLASSLNIDLGSDDYGKLYIQTGDQVLNEIVHGTQAPEVDHHSVVDSKSYSPPVRINWGEKIFGESTLEGVSVIIGYEVNSSEIY